MSTMSKIVPKGRKFVKSNKKRRNCKGMPKESVLDFLKRGGRINIIPLPTPAEILES